MRRRRNYRNIKSEDFYKVIGLDCLRWAEACEDYANGKPIDSSMMMGWFASVIYHAYSEGFEDATRRKRRRM
jgi:hypothetical protein